MATDTDTAANREDFRSERNYSDIRLVSPAEPFIWTEYQKWLTWGPEFLRSVRAARAARNAS